MRRIVKFVDHSIPDTYVWEINYLGMEGRGKQRSIEASAPSRPGSPLLMQQGSEQPMTIRLQGTILSEAQRAVFIVWYKRCELHTIEFHDVDGSIYEVQMTSFQDPASRVYLNPRGKGTWMENAKIEYTMELLVHRCISGPWAVTSP